MIDWIRVRRFAALSGKETETTHQRCLMGLHDLGCFVGTAAHYKQTQLV